MFARHDRHRDILRDLKTFTVTQRPCCQLLEYLCAHPTNTNTHQHRPSVTLEAKASESTHQPTSYSFAFSRFFSCSHCSCTLRILYQLNAPAMAPNGGKAQRRKLHHRGLLFLTSCMTLCISFSR